jgi:trehalose 2-sulfotransferase
VLATVLSALGQDSALADTVKPRTAKLADSQSDDWATRFRKGHPEHDSSS